MTDELAELRSRVEALEARRVIDVERINVVEQDGTLRMVFANSALAPDPVVDGQVLKRDSGNAAGIVFYNEHGDECGGLVFRGQRREDGYTAGAPARPAVRTGATQSQEDEHGARPSRTRRTHSVSGMDRPSPSGPPDRRKRDVHRRRSGTGLEPRGARDRTRR